MTLQDDRARPWFQPLAPTGQPHNDFSTDAGPLTTRIEGELIPPDQPLTPAPWAERLEVTQPFIPAIREQPPEFAKKLNPEPATSAPTAEDSSVDGATSVATPTEHRAAAPSSPATEKSARTPETAAEPTAERPKRRSLARRVVRRILGPDLLRKDPAPKKR
ncbi:hypothetical protein FHR84_003977 [Actinopolyspora biskrensis]|uniref:Uncharacterized protein n=1 Tax=Actinopolyspora biskrensis TaxID=1470178 RepID=A0A852Z1D1_9ACTN|nr:hypothetical protein [Actinopolyspora biskrensis]NYH80611.1 hypothetical protein [Actinopolyspora biskrensis]